MSTKLYSILYVEDDRASQKVIRGLMDTLTFPVHLHIFGDSQNFISRVEDICPEPDIFLLDIHITPLDGFEMLHELRQHPRYRSKMILALTASVMNEEVEKLKNAGFDGVLAKPLKFADFPMQIQQIIVGEHIWTVKR